MKKGMLLIIILCIVKLNAMDNNFPDINFKFGDQVNSTIVCLRKGTMKNLSPSVDIVVGYNQQQKLGDSAVNFDAKVGLIDFCKKSFYVKKRTSQNNSDDDNDINAPYQIKKIIRQEEVESIIAQRGLVFVVEPCVWHRAYNFGDTEKPFYQVNRMIGDKLGLDTYRGSDAINTALRDMKNCYDSVLNFVSGQFSESVRFQIALPLLAVGIPITNAAPVVVKSIMDYITKNPQDYSVIYLVTENNSLYNLWKSLLQQEKIVK